MQESYDLCSIFVTGSLLSDILFWLSSNHEGVNIPNSSHGWFKRKNK